MSVPIDNDFAALLDRIMPRERLADSESMPWIPLFKDQEACFYRLLRCNTENGEWVCLFKMMPGATLSRHRQTGGSSYAYILHGGWRNTEREWNATTGCLLYEPAGNVRTLIASADEGVTALLIVKGCIQYLDHQDCITGQDDVFTMYSRYVEYCAEQGWSVSDNVLL
ncbi:2,4'-dihydroxyacetophenone dioxygenase family protein [Paenibacillus sp. TRM 82003]|nr:2,4'-dihydroxyacetophenone dioxygenase family protein [Paenibacillus sp. TRM 82003]